MPSFRTLVNAAFAAQGRPSAALTGGAIWRMVLAPSSDFGIP